MIAVPSNKVIADNFLTERYIDQPTNLSTNRTTSWPTYTATVNTRE